MRQKESGIFLTLVERQKHIDKLQHEFFLGCRHKTKFHRYNNRNQASTDESNQDKIVEPDTNLEGFDSVRIHSLLEESIVTESNQSRLV